MLHRTVGMVGTTPASDEMAKRPEREVVPPTRILDGFGAFGPPPATTRPVPVGYVARSTADHPPGFYGPPEGLLAVNTLAPADRLVGLDFDPLHGRLEAYRIGEPLDLRGPVLMAALMLLVLDALVVFLLAGGIGQILRKRPQRAAATLLLAGMVAALAFGAQAFAQDNAQQRRSPPARTPVQQSDTQAAPADLDFAMKAT